MQVFNLIASTTTFGQFWRDFDHDLWQEKKNGGKAERKRSLGTFAKSSSIIAKPIGPDSHVSD